MRPLFAIVRAIAPLRRLRSLRRWQPHVGSHSDPLPSVFTQDVPAKTADDVVEIIYMRNDTARTWAATIRARFSQTVDDESGAEIVHGPPGLEIELAPGERARIGDILGWEWDSAVRRLEVEYGHAGDDGPRRVSYNLARRGYDRQVAGLGEVYQVESIEVPPHG